MGAYFWLLYLVLLLVKGGAASSAPHEVFNNNKGLCATFVRPYGYPCREFSVPTEDGFLLGVQKMTGKSKAAAAKGPAFLYHGIMQGGDIWVINPPKESLAFALADAGYDVFIGNTRSSNFSYGHVSLSDDDDAYWDWKWDDLVEHDLPTMLRFVHNQSKQSIMYVGFSQGTMTAFAAFANKDLASLVKKAAMLSPVAYLEHVKAPMLSVASWMFMDKILLLAGVSEFRVENAGGRRLINTVCKRVEHANCYDHLLDLVTGPNCCINMTRRPFYNRFEMQGTAMKNLAQMAQLVRSGDFQKYDHGIIGNLRHYHSFEPPDYDLSAIPTSLPILLIRGEKDELAAKQDADRLISELRNNPVVVVLPGYAHGDVILASNATTETFKRVLDFFQK